MALIKSGTKKGKIQEEKKRNGEKKQNMSLNIGFNTPVTKNPCQSTGYRPCVFTPRWGRGRE